jgi:hypothetical protein
MQTVRAWVLVGVVALTACTNYRDQLERADGHYRDARYESALANLEDLRGDLDRFDEQERLRYEFVRGIAGRRAPRCLRGWWCPQDLSARGDLFEQPPHDLARARLGKRVGEANRVGPGEAADLVGDVLGEAPRLSSPWRLPGRSVTNATRAWPLSSSGRPTTAASATARCATSALSISAVPRRWPATFTTSSTRPMSQK